MEALRIALCDDEPGFRILLREKIEEAFSRCGESPVITEASSASELSPLLGHMDLIFLDIDMPGLDGIRFGEQLRAQGIQTDIIYVSNMEDRVYDIFRVHPWSFIRKSRFAAEIPGAAEEYVRTRRIHFTPLLFHTADGQTILTDPAALLYAEAAGKNQKLFFADSRQNVLIRATLRELEELLIPRGFIRIHKGFLVNYRFIRKITSRNVILDSGEELPVGRDRLNAARERYLSLMKWKGISHTT